MRIVRIMIVCGGDQRDDSENDGDREDERYSEYD